MHMNLLVTFVLAFCRFSVAAEATTVMPTSDATAILAQVNLSKAKLKVLNLWASWCPPCRAELPDFAKVEKTAKDTDFFYISGDDDKDAAEAQNFIESTRVNGVKFRLKPINEEAFHQFSPGFSGSLPATFFIDQDGHVLTYSVKALNQKSLAELIKKYTLRRSGSSPKMPTRMRAK